VSDKDAVTALEDAADAVIRELDVDRPDKRIALEPDRRAPRHPAQVTADRLDSHLDEYADYLSNRDRIAFARVRECLVDIAAGRR
jgi:hypothetical protein